MTPCSLRTSSAQDITWLTPEIAGPNNPKSKKAQTHQTQDLENTATKIPETHDPEKSTNQRVGEHLFEQLWHTHTKKKAIELMASIRLNEWGLWNNSWVKNPLYIHLHLGGKPWTSCTPHSMTSWAGPNRYLKLAEMPWKQIINHLVLFSLQAIIRAPSLKWVCAAVNFCPGFCFQSMIRALGRSVTKA